MRVYALSDIHIDFKSNETAIRQISEYDYQNDILILAGDIADSIRLIELGFEILSHRFKQVFYVPGNHDLWINAAHYSDSIDKFRFIRTLGEEAHISMTPYHNERISIVPLLGWYDYSFGTPHKKLKQLWMDFKGCIWPGDLDETGITQFFLSRNDLEIPEDHRVISFSHFLPRIDLMPDHIPEPYRLVYPVLGTDRLDEQIRQIGSMLHVYGHSHVNRDVRIDGVRYVNNAFGYPDETKITAKELLCIYSDD